MPENYFHNGCIVCNNFYNEQYFKIVISMKNLFFSSLILLSSKSSKVQTVFSETFNTYEVSLLRGCTHFNCESLKTKSLRTRCLELIEAHLWSKKSCSLICFPARFKEKSIMLENKTVKNDVASNQKSEFPKLVLIDTIGCVLQKEKRDHKYMQESNVL